MEGDSFSMMGYFIGLTLIVIGIVLPSYSMYKRVRLNAAFTQDFFDE